MPPAVSIITVYYNTPKDLRNLYHSLQQHLPRELYEFIVADNDSRENLAGELSTATYLRLTENFGFARSNNLAARNANGEFLFFVNPDCVFIEDCLTPLIGVMDHAGIAAPRVLNTDRSIQVSFGQTLSLGSETFQKLRMRWEKSKFMQRRLQKKTSHPFSPGFVGGAAFLIHAALFKDLGGFDEKFFLYEEDVDLCERVRKAGRNILYVPSATIIHVRGTSAAANSQRVNLEYRKSQIYFYRKHRSNLQIFVLRLYLTLKFLFQPAMLKWIWNDDKDASVITARGKDARTVTPDGTEKMPSD